MINNDDLLAMITCIIEIKNSIQEIKYGINIQ